MTKTISYRPTPDDLVNIDIIKNRLSTKKDSQAIRYALQHALKGHLLEVSPANDMAQVLRFTTPQEEMLAKFRETTGFTTEKVIDDMFGSYFESLYKEDRPSVPRETPSALSPEKQRDLAGLRSLIEGVRPNPLGGTGVFDRKTGEVITDPEEIEARMYAQDDPIEDADAGA